MKIKITLLSFVAAGLLALPVSLRADDAGAPPAAAPAPTPPPAPAPAATPEAPAKHKHGAPFHGTLDSMDTNAMTLTVGSRTFQITSTTRITRNGQPAILSDGVVGQPVTGYYKTGDDGTTLEAVTVHFGTTTKAPRKKKHPQMNMGVTNAPSMTNTNTP